VIAQSLALAHPRQTVSRGELGHQEAAAGLRVGHGGIDGANLRTLIPDP